MFLKLINPIWWLSFFPASFKWWLGCELFALAAFPVCFFIFRVMKDRGYGFAKIFGIFFITFINWYLCTVLSFSFFSVFIAFLITAGISYLCFKRISERLIRFVKTRLKTILIYEIAFLFSFLFFVNVRSYRPEAMFYPGESGAEKMLNCAYLHALMRTSHFPPRDTWLWGERPVDETEELSGTAPEGVETEPYYINYYYFGHLMWATVAKFSFYNASYAFNLGLATIFALTFIGALSLGYNLTRRFRWGILAAFMVALFGNVDALLQLLGRIGFWLSKEGSSMTLLGVITEKFDQVFLSVDFWRSSRIMEHTVTEFPYFSAILGDLHPHHSSHPLVLLALGTAMTLVMTVKRSAGTLKDFFRNYWPHFFLFALVIGGAFATNTWDAIVLGFFGFVVMTFLSLKRHGNSWRGIGHSVVTVAVLGLSAVIFFMLFKLNFQSPIKNEIEIASWSPLKFEKFNLMFAPLKDKLRSDLADYFVMFGLFLIPLILHFSGRVKKFWGSLSRDRKWAWIIAVIFILVYSRNAWTHWLPGLAIVWLLLSVAMLLKGQTGVRTSYFYLLCIVVAFFTLYVETFYFDDRMVGDLERYNTLFKIYYPLWSFLAVCAVYSFARTFRNAVLQKRRLRLVFLDFLVLFIIGAGMLYPVQSTAVRTEQFQTTGYYDANIDSRHRTLDATAYIGKDKNYTVDVPQRGKKSVNLKDDYVIIQWIRENVEGQPVVLEAVGGCYVPFSRVASMTGIPTLVGWSHHVAQHRGGDIFQVLGPREQDIDAIYSTRDVSRAKRLLEKYDVEYVMVGSLERARYENESLEKFDDFLKPVIKEGESVLYRAP